MDDAAASARKALSRLKRAVEKAERESEILEGAIRHAEGAEFPEESYERLRRNIADLLSFTDEEGERLRDKILQTGGLEPGRVRRTLS